MQNTITHRFGEPLTKDNRSGLRPINGCLGAGIVVLACHVSACSHPALQWPGGATPGGPATVAVGTKVATCASVLHRVHQTIANAKTGDAEARRVPGFPYLRTNRFLSHIGQRIGPHASKSAFEAWIDRMRALDAEATRIEIANLPASTLTRLNRSIFGRADSADQLATTTDKCASKLRAVRWASGRQRRQLIKSAVVADNYSGIARAIGLYPLASIPVAKGWEQWKKENLASFNRPIARLPVRGRLVAFGPQSQDHILSPQQVRKIVERSRDPALGIPEPKGRNLRRLFGTFAPVWLIDVKGNYDLIGQPAWTADARSIRIDQSRPTVFTRISHAIVGKEVLLQLNYSIWFPERPSTGPLDLLAGKLDGLIWRVTLATNGRPLLYDSIHACGCYHLLFPTKRLQAGIRYRAPDDIKEVPAVLSGAPQPTSRQRVLLRIASASHYLVGASVISSTSRKYKNRVDYRFVPARTLRSLPLLQGQRRSLFRHDGLVAGTERLERFTLWPTGVQSPGAMRQWGNHAIAFVDRRHFDDPDLIAKLFGR